MDGEKLPSLWPMNVPWGKGTPHRAEEPAETEGRLGNPGPTSDGTPGTRPRSVLDDTEV